jgi:WD40 repeat protein
VLATPDKQKGHVKITIYEKNYTSIIQAHQSSLSCLALNYSGSLLATASDKGTLIRLFSTEDGSPLQEVRRGTDKAEIYSIAFDK